MESFGTLNLGRGDVVEAIIGANFVGLNLAEHREDQDRYVKHVLGCRRCMDLEPCKTGTRLYRAFKKAEGI
jgi:hypothetical protein